MHFVRLAFEPPEKSPYSIITRGSINKFLFLGFCKTVKGDIYRDSAASAKGHHVFKFHTVIRPIPPGLDGPLLQRTTGVRDDEIQINVNVSAKAPACLARPNRAVKGKTVRDWLAVANFAGGAFKEVAKAKMLDSVLVLPYPQIHFALSKTECLLQGINNARPLLGPHQYPVRYYMKLFFIFRLIAQLKGPDPTFRKDAGKAHLI
jgi:hypothetical protein